jgi:hypothetical protein
MMKARVPTDLVCGLVLTGLIMKRTIVTCALALAGSE